MGCTTWIAGLEQHSELSADIDRYELERLACELICRSGLMQEISIPKLNQQFRIPNQEGK